MDLWKPERLKVHYGCRRQRWGPNYEPEADFPGGLPFHATQYFLRLADDILPILPLPVSII